LSRETRAALVKVPRLLLPSVALISAAAIGYEVLLMRLLSIIHWHHFAYMVISLALLGYGVSGTFVALARHRLQTRFVLSYTTSALAFGFAMPLCFLLAQHIPFNALEVVWEPRQLLFLSVLYLLFFVPFLFAATCIGLALTRFSAMAARIYAFDLVGAGCGALLVIAALFVMPPQNGLRLLAGCALLAALMMAAGALRTRSRRVLAAVSAAALTALLLTLPQHWLSLRLSPFKGLSQTLAVVDTQRLGEHSNPLGQLSVVANPTIPFRHAPGLSLNATRGPPEQLAVFTDGDAMSVITRYDGTREPLSYLGSTTAAAPYQVLREPHVLILGAGGGQDVLRARYHGARRIDAVELNPLMVDLLTGPYAEFAGRLYSRKDTHVHIGEARAFVASSDRQYDLIQMALLDSAAAAGAGVQALSESYVYTIEAIGAYLQRLAPGGLLAITRWLKLPPRDSLKLFATALEALRQSDVRDPEQHLILLRSWNTTTLLIGKRAFTPAEVDTLREFCRARSFDVVYVPGMQSDEANRYNLLDRAHFAHGAMQLLRNRDEFIERYKFHIAPASDDSPYFFHFFKWRALPELLAMRAQGGAALIEWGYLIVLATLLQALVAGGLLILLPLAITGRTAFGRTGVRMGGYFFVLGLAFLFLEIAFIQKLVLFLGHPLYAVTVVLSGFLVFAGAGSGLASARLAKRPGGRAHTVKPAVTGIMVLCAAYLLALPGFLPLVIGWPDPFKVLLALLLIAPLAFCMGMPFPLGLARVSAWSRDFVPWAWGINGFASVLSATLATLLAIEFGFTVLVAAGAALYFVAAVMLPR
jgi:spermidine synthase